MREWQKIRMKELCDLLNGFAFKSQDYLENSNTFNIRMSNIRPDGKFDSDYQPRYLPDEYADKYSRFLLEDGDLIIAMTDMANDPKILGIPTIVKNKGSRNFLLNQRVGKITNTNINKITSDFMRYYLMQDRIRIFYKRTAKKGIQININKADILSVEIHLPPIEEQQTIAWFLSLVQDAIAQQEQLITLTTELKKALMQKLFTEGTRGEPQKMTEISLIPESWDCIKLKDAAESFQYGTSVKCDYEKHGKPVLRIPNVIGGYVDISDLKYGQPKPNEIESLKLLDGDILFVRTNGTKENSGRCSMYRGELGNDCYFASYLIRVRIDKNKLFPAFVDEYTRTDIGISFLSGQAIRTADGKFNINSGTLQRMLVPQPSLDEQREIADILFNIDTKINNYLSRKEQLQDLFRTLLHQLMTAQIGVDDLNLSALNLEIRGGNE
ncbi:restriction endonuclease subunit S [Anabaena sp. FACHB-1237]|uniref:restriction endonuclease subunit S n=1 Tax=Anabaena sp. FACHB-1237 TaxID=2692769 RepID=UPI0016808A87|nr:restriction endonuclease subunit S [Anabaena sp. FACHB-1237]MBD2139641.1 restriction endonuclease subunit S [Anabaena sp. FACHB-1237]